MSKYLDDSTEASLPGGLDLSEAKLRELDPELFAERTFKCGPLCDVDHPAAAIRERLAEHVQSGCCGPAVVVSTAPLVVAAYASDLDASVLLRFPSSFVERYGLEVGSRLVAVSLFQDAKEGGEPYYAVDLIPGPARTNWSGFAPCIAEFVSDQEDLIRQRHREISAEEWKALERTAKLRIERLGLETARDGRPSRMAFPERMGGDASFQPLSQAGQRPGAGPWKKVILNVLLAVAAVIALFVLKSMRR